MRSRPIYINSLLQLEDASGKEVHYRVLHIDKDMGGTGRVALIDVDDATSFPVWRSPAELGQGIVDGSIRIVSDDPYHAETLSDSEYSDKSLFIRDERWRVLGPVVSDHSSSEQLLQRSTRGPILRRLHEESGVALDKLYRWLKQYWRRGQTVNALLPNYQRCGAPGKIRASGKKKRGRPSKLALAEPGMEGMNVTENDRRFLVTGGDRFWGKRVDGRVLTKREAFQKTLETFFYERLEFREGVLVPVLKSQELLPTFRQFNYWYEKHLNVEKAARAREGERRYVLENRPVLGSTNHLSRGPGDLFLIDATVGDLYLISSVDPRYVIGRPILYLVIDHWSRMIVGVYVGLEGPSWLGAMMALENAFTEKVSFCEHYGIPITESDWPCSVYPQAITADRGEMVGMESDKLVSAFNIRVTNTPAFRADFKSFVERQFRTTNELGIKRQPGWVDKVKRRGEDYRYDATLNLRHFNQMMIHLILHSNQKRRIRGEVPPGYPLSRGREPSPQDIWTWGIENQRGLGRVMDRERVRAGLLPTTKARPEREGLVVHAGRLKYESATAHERGWYVAKTGRKPGSVEVSYDPRDVSSVFLRLDGGRLVEECPLTPSHMPRYGGKTLDEVLDLWDRRDIAHQMDRSSRHQDEAGHNAQLEALTTRAKAEQEEALGAGRRPNVNGIRESRSEERSMIRTRQAFTSGPDDDAFEASDYDEDVYIPMPD